MTISLDHAITERDVEQYWEQGYWISPVLLDADRVERLRHAVDRACAGEIDGDGGYFNGGYTPTDDPLAMKRVINAWWINDQIKAMVLDPLIGQMVATLMKVPAARLWADQVIIKPGQGAEGHAKQGNVGWHQDATYWQISDRRLNMVTAWIALQDTDLSNGGMRTLVGSHRWGLIEDSDRFYDPDLDSQREYFKKKGDGTWIDEPCLLRAGQMSFHHSLCFHGSEENRTDEPRMSVIGHYMPDGTRFTPSHKPQVFKHLLGPHPAPGTPLTDPAFPRVWPPQSDSGNQPA